MGAKAKADASARPHTAGPWTASAYSSIVGALIEGARNRVAAALPLSDRAEAEANARLIAAAPELLWVVKEWLAAPKWLGRESDAFEHVVKVARAAIAKAEGRS